MTDSQTIPLAGEANVRHAIQLRSARALQVLLVELGQARISADGAGTWDDANEDVDLVVELIHREVERLLGDPDALLDWADRWALIGAVARLALKSYSGTGHYRNALADLVSTLHVLPSLLEV